MRVTVSEAAKALGVSSQFIRTGLQRKTLPIGTAVKMKRWVYYINPHQLQMYIGTANPDDQQKGIIK